MELVRDYWAQLIGVVGLIVWGIRVESQTKANASEIQRLWQQRAEDLAAHKEAREATNALLAEVRNDIKTLLGRVRH